MASTGKGGKFTKEFHELIAAIGECKSKVGPTSALHAVHGARVCHAGLVLRGRAPGSPAACGRAGE